MVMTRYNFFIYNNYLLLRFQFLLLENIKISFLKYPVMSGWEFGSLISEGNLIGWKIYRLII